MGAFHTICTLLRIIGKRFQDAGLRELCIESQVTAEGLLTGVLEGRIYNHAMRLHKLVYEALMRKAWSGFRMWMAEKHNEKKSLVDNMLVSLQSLYDNVCEDEFQKKLGENSSSEVTELFEEYMLLLCHENGKLSAFWVSYLDFVDILLAMIRASREGDWDLYVSSITNLTLYARSLSLYLLEMSDLEEEHPDVLMYLQSGGFSVQIGEDNPFGKIPVDQACEKTVNKDTQAPGGTKAVNKYYLISKYRSIFMRNLKDTLHLSSSSCQHNDLQKSRIARDEAGVQSLPSALEGWVNPFQSQGQDLIYLSTGKMAPEDVACDLLQAKDLGERAYRIFSKERLEVNPPKARFHDTMSRAKLKIFSAMNKKVELRKGTAKEVVLKANRALFTQMIVIAEARQLSMKEVLSHLLGLLPWSLADPDGSLKKTAKSSLAKELQKDAPAAENLPSQSGCCYTCCSAPWFRVV